MKNYIKEINNIAKEKRLKSRGIKLPLLTRHEMVLQNRSFWQNDIVRICISMSLTGQIVLWIMIFTYFNTFDQKIIFLYNIYLGVTIHQMSYMTTIIPVGSLALSAINIMIGFFLYQKKQRIGTYSILLTAVFIHVVSIVVLVNLISINY